MENLRTSLHQPINHISLNDGLNDRRSKGKGGTAKIRKVVICTENTEHENNDILLCLRLMKRG